MQGYVCGFFFSPDRARVLLIRKRRPAWQAGLLNGVGGKIEPGETPEQAIEREFLEEAGLRVSSWQQVVELTGPDWRGHFFRAFGNIDSARTVTDEQLEVHSIAALPGDTIPNLRWQVPLMLDDEVVQGVYAVRIRPVRRETSIGYYLRD